MADKTKAQLEAELAELKAKLEAKESVVSDAGPDIGPDVETPVPPSWRALVDEILGPNVPCFLELPENGGQKFGVYIPRELSNASQMHWSMHTRDKRSKELANTGIKGVKEFLLRVRKNLLASGAKLPVYQNN